MKVTDEWLYEKMPIVDAAMVRQLEVCTQKKYVFSDKFRKRMKRLIQKEKYMYAEKQLKKITQKIAAAAVVMLVGALTVTMSVEAYRVRFFHTIKMVLDGNISIYSYESDEEKISDTIFQNGGFRRRAVGSGAAGQQQCRRQCQRGQLSEKMHHKPSLKRKDSGCLYHSRIVK